jgi:hypothetical protein
MVRLQSYGFEPMSGQLKTIGDFASAMGKDIQDAVEAVSDASNNEWERMKEFAVNREMVQRAAPDAFNSNGSIINRTKAMMALFKIMEERGAGGMERRMDTIAGKWSNVQDAMWRTWVAIGQAAGPAIKSSLDWLIGKLDGIAEWAKRNGPMLQKTFTEIFKAGMFWAEKLLLKMAKLAAKLVGIAHDWQDIDKMKVPTAAKWLMKWGVVEGNMMGLPGATSNDIYDKWMKAWEQAKNAAPGKGGLSDLIDPLWGIQSNTAKTAEALEKMNPIMGGGALTKAWTAFARFRQNTLPGVSAGPSFATAGAGSMGPIQITIRNSSGGPLDAAVKAIAQDVLSQFASQLGAALKGSKRA